MAPKGHIVFSNLFTISQQGFNALFDYLANDSKIVTWIASTDFIKQIYLSKSFESLFGWSKQVMYEDMTLWRRFLLPEDKKSALHHLFLPNPDTENCKTMFYRCFDPRGQILHVKDHHFSLHNEENQLMAHAGYCAILSNEEWSNARAKRCSNASSEFQALNGLVKREFNLDVNPDFQTSQQSISSHKPYTLMIKERCIQLTTREAETLYYLMCGHSTKVIAQHLDISPRTVEIHITHIRSKANTRSRLELLSKISNPDDIASWFLVSK